MTFYDFTEDWSAPHQHRRQQRLAGALLSRQRLGPGEDAETWRTEELAEWASEAFHMGDRFIVMVMLPKGNNIIKRKLPILIANSHEMGTFSLLLSWDISVLNVMRYK